MKLEISAGEKRHLLARWLVLVLSAAVVPLPYYTPMVSGTTPLLLLVLIAIGDRYSWETSLINIGLSTLYAVIFYWLSGRLANYLIQTSVVARRRASGALFVAMFILSISPIFGLGIQDIDFRNLYVFYRWELFKVGAIHRMPAEHEQMIRKRMGIPRASHVYEEIDAGYSDKEMSGSPGSYQTVVMHMLADNLQRAIRDRSFLHFVTKPPIVWWSTCGSGYRRTEHRLDEVVPRLTAMSGDRSIEVNLVPIGELNGFAIETRGWQDPERYVYFSFLGNEQHALFRGIYVCDKRTSDAEYSSPQFVSTAQGSAGDADVQTVDALPLVLKTASERGDFGVLKRYALSGPNIEFDECNILGTDAPPATLSLEEANRVVVESIGDSAIHINAFPNSTVNKEGTGVYLETEGWNSEKPYMGFSFEYQKEEKRWAWTRLCDSSLPALDEKSAPYPYYKPRYVKEPVLPRPGPRVFKAQSTLRDRLREALRFKKYETVENYAVRGTLPFGLCRVGADGFAIKGHSAKAAEIVEFLRTGTPENPVSEPSGFLGTTLDNLQSLFSWNSRNEGSSYYGSPGKPAFETKINGPYPYVAFWADEAQEKEKWEWSGVSYCNVPHQSLLFPDDPPYRQVKK